MQSLDLHQRNNGYSIGIGITFNSEILHSKIEGSSSRFFPFSAVTAERFSWLLYFLALLKSVRYAPEISGP
jgi:hypothetical protein